MNKPLNYWKALFRKYRETHGEKVSSVFNGICYQIPVRKIIELLKYISDEWEPMMERGMITDNGVKRIPTNIRALSFTNFLREWYEREFSEYSEIKGITHG